MINSRHLMHRKIFSGPPSPEEFQRQLSEFMRQHFQSSQSATTHSPQDADNVPTDRETNGSNEDILRFDRKPRDVKAYLDRFVIKQDEAKKVLSVALCDHYHHVRLAMEGREQPSYAKQNLILVGPTGVGETTNLAILLRFD